MTTLSSLPSISFESKTVVLNAKIFITDLSAVADLAPAADFSVRYTDILTDILKQVKHIFF